MFENFKLILQELKIPILISSILYTIGPILSSLLIPAYLHQYRVFTQSPTWRYALSFDGLIFILNKYQWEQSFAFLPGYTYLLRVLQYIIPPFWNMPEGLIIMAIAVNKVLNVLNCVLLVSIGERVLSKKGSRLAGILFLFNPAAIFYHSVYSESLYLFVTLIGIVHSLQSKANPNDPLKYIGSNCIGLAAFSLSTVIRTTGMFYSLIYAGPILASLFKELSLRRWNNLPKLIVSGILTLLFLILPFGIYLWVGYRQFCNQAIRSPFCNNSIPNIYSYIQDKFWDVGFLKYYFKGQQMQCVFGLITIFFVALSFSTSMYKSLQLKGLLVSLIPITLLIVFYANVQSGTRFISTHPAFYFNLAKYLMDRSGTLTPMRKLVVLYFAVFNMFGMVFFPARFSWA